METKEELSVVADDIVEVAQDSVKLAEDLVRLARRQRVLVPAALVVGAVIGGVAGYHFAKKRLTLRFEVLLEAELEKADAVYARKYKVEEFATPESTLEKLHGADAMAKYKPPVPILPQEPAVTPPADDPRPPAETVVRRNVFTDNEWNIEQEKSKRASDPSVPYVISEEEYMEGEPKYEQVTLTYYEEDQTLSDAKDDKVDNVDYIVGEGNLMRFGHGSNDPRVVYIRNDGISIDFEVVKSQGSYGQEVAGELKHSWTPGRTHRRTGDDE